MFRLALPVFVSRRCRTIRLPGKGAGRASNGNFMLTEFVVRYRVGGEGEEMPVALQNASESFAQKGEGKGKEAPG